MKVQLNLAGRVGGLSGLLESVSWHQGVSAKGQEQSQAPPGLDPRLPCPCPVSRWPWEGTRHSVEMQAHLSSKCMGVKGT